MTPDFVATYAAVSAVAVKAATEAVLMIDPPVPCSRIASTACLQPQNTELRLVRKDRSQSSFVV